MALAVEICVEAFMDELLFDLRFAGSRCENC